MGTMTTRNHKYVVAPVLSQMGYGERKGQLPRVSDVESPLWTVVGGGTKAALVTAFLAKHYTGAIGSDLKEPVGAVTSIDHHSLVTSHITKLRHKDIGHGTDEPLHTISAQGTHFGEIRALLVKYYKSGNGGSKLGEPMPTITTKDRMGLVIVKINGEPYAISDIGMRMLQPHELYKAQGFPDNYIFDATAEGKPLSKTAQVRMCGNSVCPPIAAAIVRANYSDGIFGGNA
jgi:DNA (cytosine-5)-methyltransferase 1